MISKTFYENYVQFTLLSRSNLSSKALRYDTCYTRDHTVLPATKHEPYISLLPSRRASPPYGWYSLRLPTEGWPGWVDMGGWLDWDKFPHEELNPHTVTHPSTNRARRRVTSLIWPTSLPTSPNRHRRRRIMRFSLKSCWIAQLFRRKV